MWVSLFSENRYMGRRMFGNHPNKMAASDQTKCSTDVTEDNRTACCSPCSDDGSYTAAGHYCLDCEMYFCGKCLKYHNKMPALKSHQVNDIDSTVTATSDDKAKDREDLSAETIRCTIHPDKQIDTFCKDHNEVCCGTCALVKHRLCSTESIVEASQGIQSSPDVKESKDALTQVLSRLKEVKDKRTENIDRVDQQKLEHIETVDSYEERIIAKVTELANMSRKEIRLKHQEHKTVLDIDIGALDAAMTTTASYVDKLKHTGNDPLLFANVHNSKTVLKDGEMLLEAMVKEWRDKEIIFHVDRTLEQYVDRMKSLGHVDDGCPIKEYTATFQKNIMIKQHNEEDTLVYDMCFMESGDLVVTAHRNCKLKRYSSWLQYKDEIDLSGNPVAVCRTGEQEIAVRIWDSEVVHIVSVGQSMQLTSSFRLAGNGRGMAYSASTEALFVCEDDKVSVYSKTGNKLRTYDKDTNGESMFSALRQISLSANNQDIYVTDFHRGLIALDKKGNMKMKVSDMSGAFPLCLLPGNMCLTGNRDSNVIVHIDKDGKQVGALTNTMNGRTQTYCAVYDKERSRLLVGGCPSLISVYTISAK